MSPAFAVMANLRIETGHDNARHESSPHCFSLRVICCRDLKEPFVDLYCSFNVEQNRRSWRRNLVRERERERERESVCVCVCECVCVCV